MSVLQTLYGIVPDDGVAGAHFGSTLALDDDLALIRASRHPPAGKAYVYAGMSPADCNANGTPDACDLRGDADGDGVVNVEDLIAVILAWGPCPPCAADLDCSGAVDFADIVAVIANWT